MKVSLESPTSEQRALPAQSPPPSLWRTRHIAVLAAGVSLLACSGNIGPSGNAQGTDAPNANDPSAMPGTVVDPTMPGATTTTVPPGAVVTNPPAMSAPDSTLPLDVNRVAIHRLNKAEYDNTMRDLLGVTDTPASSFIADEKAFGFDNIASAFGMTDVQYEAYFNAADQLVETVFADPALSARILTCTPASAADTACIGQILGTFGTRAWRRPLDASETMRLTAVATDAMAAGEDPVGGVKQMVKVMLSSLSFLYRIEFDPNPASAEAHPLNGYELASRLSYLGWSSMPDETLFGLAASGELLQTATLEAQVDRMLADPKADNFVANFAGQWLGMRDLLNHTVEPTVFPSWNASLQQAMAEEGLMFFKEFLTGGRSMTEFLTTDVNFVNSTLAQHYGIQGGGAGDTLTAVTNTTDDRVGFMGLAGFLTLTSFPYRTAPTLRGKWVLENLLCQEIPTPPPNVPDLDDPAASSADLQSENVRIRLEAHRVDPACAACHTILDPIGMGLENFDAIGRYRTQYDNGDAVDPSGVLPDGSQFQSLAQLAQILSGDTKLTDCVSERLMTYALGREVVASDAPYLAQIRQNWASGAMGLRELMKQIVLNDTFRFRRGETGAAQ